jgi:hypothetical protein
MEESMSYKSDFENDSGWSAADTNRRAIGSNGSLFRAFLKSNGVGTVIRYYATSRTNSKTLTDAEARLLSADGFNILPVFQDRNRKPEDFGAAKGRSNAQSALDFAAYIGQPSGSTILFAVDADFGADETDDLIVPYFEEVRQKLGSSYKVGAYGSGLVLTRLLEEDLIDVPWISMSRLFRGTKEFFYADEWAFRQVPPDRTHGDSGFSYDRNVLRWSPAELGAFRVAAAVPELVAGGDAGEAILGGANVSLAAAAAAATTHYVGTEGLNLRETPDGTIIRALTIGQPVSDLGAADVDGWRRVEIDGQRGFVFGKYLRKPAAPEVEALLRAAIAEWVRFDKGQANEASDPYYLYVGEMWEAIGESYDGRSHYPDGDEVPWSAAFISFVVRKAGAAYASFKFNASHSVFSNDAIQARILSRTNRPFWGYRLTEAKPGLGDIIHRNRGSGTYSFDYAENHSDFKSHSDIVVEVTPQVVRVIGGNVSDTVSLRKVEGGDDIQEYELDANGYIAPGQRVIAVLKNRAANVS